MISSKQKCISRHIGSWDKVYNIGLGSRRVLLLLLEHIHSVAEVRRIGRYKYPRLGLWTDHCCYCLVTTHRQVRLP
jgi:hypothetical protein